MGVEVWALSDLHLGPGAGKGHFSSSWKDHQPKIRTSWDERIPQDALVLMPGDFSWHQNPDDLKYDYHWINERPGFKVLSPGNHDYGVWTSHEEAEAFVSQFERMRAIYGRAIRLENPVADDGSAIIVFSACGTAAPEDKYFNSNGGASSGKQDKEIVRFFRELALLKAAIEEAKSLQQPGDQLVAMFHYPPFADGTDDSVWSRAMEDAGVNVCLYGHLHQSTQWKSMIQGEHNGVEYRFVGADFLDFKPTQIGEWQADGLTLAPIEVVGSTTSTSSSSSSTWYDEDDYYGSFWMGAGYGSSVPSHPDVITSTAKDTTPVVKTAAVKTDPSGFFTQNGVKMVDAGHWSDRDSGAYKVDDLELDRFDHPQSCLECDQLLIKGEPYQRVTDGIIHGEETDEGCPFAADEADELARVTAVSEPVVTAPEVSQAVQTVAPDTEGSQTREPTSTDEKYSLDAHGIRRVCRECGEPIAAGAPWHWSGGGPVHGGALTGTSASCAKTTTLPVVAPTPKTTSAATPADNDSPAGHPVKTGMNCFVCHRRIFKSEPWHNTARGKTHGWGSYTEVATCHKTPAVGSQAPVVTSQQPVSLAKPPVSNTTKPFTAQSSYSSGYSGGYTTAGSYRPSSLTLKEATELDGWADEYMRGEISLETLTDRAKPFMTSTTYSGTTTTYSGTTTTVTSSVKPATGFQQSSIPHDDVDLEW